MSAAKRLRLYHRLQLAAHRIQKAADRALAEAAGITTAQAAVLAVVAIEGSAIQRSVADQLGLNESAVTAMAQKLIGMGLITRTRDAGDARAWRLELTPQGQAALSAVEAPFAAINARIDATLGDPDAFAADLSRLAARFDA